MHDDYPPFRLDQGAAEPEDVQPGRVGAPDLVSTTA
jgi:hypothetical protein